MKRFILFPLVVPMLAGLAVVFSGCEDGGTDGASFYINPSSYIFSSTNTAIALEAVGGHNPLKWSVSDDSIGAVSGEGQTVTYTRTTKYGVNLVTVTDSMSWTATCTISQPEPGATVTNTLPTVSPTSATLDSDGDQVVFTAGGGKEPYSWGVGDGSRGHITSYAHNQTLYTRDSAGDNTVTLYDANGNVAVASISQPLTAVVAIAPASATVAATNGTQLFTASGGTGTYTWSIASGNGSVSPGTGTTTVYTSADVGTTYVQVTDSDGNTAVATVSKNTP